MGKVTVRNDATVKDFYETFDFERMINGNAPKLIQDYISREINFVNNYFESGSSILEIGCGYGRMLEILSKKAKTVTGIDFSRRMVDLSNKKLSHLNNVQIKLMNADKILFDDGFFDYVVCLNGTFNNMPNIELAVLKEMKRVCRKEGEIIVSVLSEKARDAQRQNYERMGLDIIFDEGNVIRTSEGLYSRRFARRELEVLFEKAGINCRITSVSLIDYIAYGVKK